MLVDDNMPLVLVNIIGEVNQRVPGRTNRDEFYSIWDEYLLKVAREIPGVHIGDGGATISLGEISPGCRLCKNGRWDCIFVTGRCNLNCGFCINSISGNRNGFFSSLGSDAGELTDNYSKAGIKGISFSGGEALLSFDETVSLLIQLKEHFPDNYFWLYTNGLILTENHIEKLSDYGIDEIRFNLAATGYDNLDVLNRVESASMKIKNITVEIPVIPEDRDKLLAVLETWSDAGVKFLNLHELMREMNSNSYSLKGEFKRLYLEDGHVTDIELKSKTSVLEIIGRIQKRRIPLNINFCSIVNKFHQLSGRRNIFAGIVKTAEEKRVDNDCLESVIAYRSPEDYFFVHPDNAERLKNEYKNYSFTLIRRTVPLSLHDRGVYISAVNI